MIEITDLEVRRGGALLCSLSELRVEAGERVGIRGANGTGKTTLLKLLAGLETASAGRVVLSVPRGRRTYVHQSPFLFRGSVADNAVYGLRAAGLSRQEAVQRVEPLLVGLGIAGLEHRNARSLSGGERRRVALARALVLEPALLLLDEPLSDLDTPGRDRVVGALLELEGTTVLVASPVELPAQLVQRSITLGT